MPLKSVGTIAIANSEGSAFDHGAFDPKTRRVFVAHTSRDSVAVIDHDTGKHIASLEGFPKVAGVAADDGMVLVTNRDAASLAWVDAESLKMCAVFDTGPRPNGVAIVAKEKLGIVACIGDDRHPPVLLTQHLTGKQHRLDLPGQPRWCVADATGTRVFLAIREPSMVLVARLLDLGEVQHWHLPVGGAHGLDIDHRRNRLYVACDERALVEVNASSGEMTNQWQLAGSPYVTFVNLVTGLVHVAIGDPGLVQSINPRTGDSTQFVTAKGAHTTTFVAPNHLYVFSPNQGEQFRLRKIDTSPTVQLCRALPAFMFAAAILGLAEFSALAAGTRIDRGTIWIDLAGDPVGKPPPDFVFWQTGHGRWSIVRDSSTESGAAIEQSGAGTQEAQPSLAVYQPDSLKNVVVSARIKLVKGSLQTAGLAVRVTAPKTYYAAVVNAVEGRVELFRFDAGKRQWLADAEADVEEGHWQSFQIAVADDHFSVSLDGQVLFDAWDHGYVGDGRVALWTEENNSTLFDNIFITPRPYAEGNR